MASLRKCHTNTWCPTPKTTHPTVGCRNGNGLPDQKHPPNRPCRPPSKIECDPPPSPERKIPRISFLPFREKHKSYLDATFGMLTWTEEERAVYKGISIEYQQLFFAQHAMNPRAPLGRQRRQDETSGVVISVVTFILCLQQKHEISIQTRDKAKTDAILRCALIGVRQHPGRD